MWDMRWKQTAFIASENQRLPQIERGTLLMMPPQESKLPLTRFIIMVSQLWLFHPHQKIPYLGIRCHWWCQVRGERNHFVLSKWWIVHQTKCFLISLLFTVMSQRNAHWSKKTNFLSRNYQGFDVWKMQILWKMKLWICEFCEKWDFVSMNVNVNF